MMIKLIEFDASAKGLLHDYQRLKYDVFVREGGWDLPSIGSQVQLDKFDDASWFVAAVCDEMFGVLRVVPWSRSIPYESMLKELLEKCKPSDRRLTVSITSLAVRKKWRGRSVACDLGGAKKTIAEAMYWQAERRMVADNQHLVVANVSLSRAFFFFRKVGFRVLDAPRFYSEHPYPVVTMARAVGEQVLSSSSQTRGRSDLVRLKCVLEESEASATHRWKREIDPPYSFSEWLPS